MVTFSRSCGGTGLEEDTLLMDLLRKSFRHKIISKLEKRSCAVRNIKLIVI